MATNTTKTDNSGAIQNQGGLMVVGQETIDFSHKDFNTSAASDVIQVMNIPAGTVVLKVYTHVVTAEGGTLTFDVGDGTDPNGWDDAVDGNSTGMNATTEGTDALADSLGAGAGKYYSADDTIDITLDNAADAAKIHLIAVGFKSTEA